MAEETLQEIFATEFSTPEEFAEWFVRHFQDQDRDKTTKQKTACTIEEFAVHFLALIRSQTEDFTKCPPSVCDTPKKVPPGPPPATSAPTIRKLSITSSAADPLAATVNAPLSLSTSVDEQQHQLTSGLKRDTTATTGIGVRDGDGVGDSPAFGNRAQGRSISRDLFVGAPTADAFRDLGNVEDDGGFHGSFRKIEPDAAGRGGEETVGMDESEKHISIVDAPFSPIPTARHPGQPINAASRIDFGTAAVSTPIRGGQPSNKLNTSTPINRSQGGKAGNSRNSWTTLAECSTPGGNGNGSRNDSRRSHDRSGNRQTSSPCLGDFITHSSMKSKSRKSLNVSKDANKSASSIFMENDFPGLGTSMQSSTPGTGGDQQQRNKKRVTPITVSKTLTSRLGGSSFEMDNLVSGGSPAAEGKSRRRVTPTILSRSTSSRHDFNSSSFKSDNNLINLTEDNSLELDLSQKDERGLLRNYKDIIKSNFEAAEEQNPDPSKMIHAALRNTINTPRKNSESGNTPPLIIELDKVTNPTKINRLVDVYTLIIDLNLTPNILSEFSYLINLINTEFDPFEAISTFNADSPDFHNILKNLNNCIYFAMEVLNRQRNLLALLDSITLKVLVENERIAGLNVLLHAFLREIHSQKLQLDSSGQRMLEESVQLGGGGAGGNGVLYQQEADTKEHFPSEREFGAFKKQRDAFCTIYRTWDFKHLNPTWNFLAELGGKVRALLAIMEHPINMAHLAKLFTAQLVQSCNFHNSAASELAMALPNVDPAKLVKLRQRLVAPSQFSTQYLFPGSQAFFRDFIIAAEANQIFIEQLKAALIHELVGMNDSSYEVLNVSSSGSSQHESEYVVRPESTTTMRVLAKFIGYIISRPFNYDSYRNSTVDNRQIELRNELLPLFDVKSILVRAIAERKLIITVPWLVQYLAMLDGISLRLAYYRGLFDVLYELYLRTSSVELLRHGTAADRKLLVTPTSKFIIRVSLGWLFEHPNVPEEYYSYRQERRGSGVIVDQGLLSYKKIELSLDKVNAEEVQSHQGIPKGEEENKSSLIKYDPSAVEESVPLNPLLESILNAACPFLADFRVSMMPSKLEKTVSRSGRYRHITTKYSGATTVPSAKQKPTNDQHKLLEAFLQSQSLSVRRTVEFVIERTSSAAVKDFQIAELLPKRKKITEQIATLEADTLSAATKRIYVICTEALAEINASWDAQLPASLARRIKEGFDALLPNETLEAVKRTCINLALERCLAKTNEWRQTHMLEIDLFCKDIQGEAAKAVRPSSLDADPSSSSLAKAPQPISSQAPLTVVLGRVQHTAVYERLQALVHVAASYPDELGPEELVQFLALVGRYLDEQDGTPTMNKTLAYMLLQLALLLVINRCDLIVPDIVQSLLAVWKHRKLVEFCQIPETGGDGNGGSGGEEEEIERLIMAEQNEDGERSLVDEADIQRIRDRKQQEEANYIFSTLVSNRYIRMMEFSQQQHQQQQNQNQQQQQRTVDEVFACFANFISSLVDSNLITIRRLNEQFVRIFNEDWQQHTLERVSRLMEAVLRSGRGDSSSAQDGGGGFGPGGRPAGTADDSHSQLFLEMLSDLAREIEDF
uniref:Protein disks lost n=1 Tax=Culex pipiens TaxID=7175 RepID=A0A8D8JN52_CULPI